MTPVLAAFLILLLPLAAFAFQIFGGSKLPGQGWYIPTGAILVSLALSLWLLLGQVLPAGDPAWGHTLQWEFIRVGDFAMPLGVRIDNICVVMLIVVTTVSSLVHIFSSGYMAEDPRKGRFFGYLGLFSFSMLWLVMSDSLLGIFMGWELVGLSSYLLIGFWFERKGPPEAGMKAFVTNRVGDLGFLGALMIIMWQFGTFSLTELEAIVQGFGAGLPEDLALWMTLAGIGLFCGAVGKSAQFPLHVWLPDAMEGPTPVSALIHAATMVAAGVYLMVRVFFLLTFDASLVVAYVGGFTALMSATIALTQWDIKRVLAYSTISQLGYMVLAVGVGAYSAGFLHLMTHAFFKACLFLGSGSVIHAMHHVYHHVHDHHRDPQDMRNMGGLKSKLPITYWTFLFATLALAGVPLTSGFISKDAILAGSLAFAMEHPAHWPLAFFGFTAAMLTAFYMFRLVFLTFHGEHKGKPGEFELFHENKPNLTGPLVVLATLSFFLFYTPNPTDAAAGWFYRLMPKPAQPVLHPVPAPAQVAPTWLASRGVGEGGTQGTYGTNGTNGTNGVDEGVELGGGAEGATAGAAVQVAAVDPHAAVVEPQDPLAAGADSPVASAMGTQAPDSGLAPEVATHAAEEAHVAAHADHAAHEAHLAHIHHTAHIQAMLISVVIVILSISAAWFTYLKHKVDPAKVAAALPGLHRFLFNKWYFDELYRATVIAFTLWVARVCAWFDRVVIDGLVNGAASVTVRKSEFVGRFDNVVVDGAVNGTGWVARTAGAGMRMLQGGDIQGYLVKALAGVVLILIWQVL
jgi:NADH-quinone oxidoreductase subunit L